MTTKDDKELSRPITRASTGISSRVTAVESQLDKVNDELSRNTRRLDEIQRSVDVVSADRKILEDIQGKLTELKETVKLNSDALVNTKKELKDEVRTNTEIMENRIKQIENAPTNYNFIVIKKIGKYFLGKLK